MNSTNKIPFPFLFVKPWPFHAGVPLAYFCPKRGSSKHYIVREICKRWTFPWGNHSETIGKDFSIYTIEYNGKSFPCGWAHRSETTRMAKCHMEQVKTLTGIFGEILCKACPRKVMLVEWESLIQNRLTWLKLMNKVVPLPYAQLFSVWKKNRNIDLNSFQHHLLRCTFFVVCFKHFHMPCYLHVYWLEATLAAVKCGRTVRRAWEEQEVKTLFCFDKEVKLWYSKLLSCFSIRYASWSFLKKKTFFYMRNNCSRN